MADITQIYSFDYESWTVVVTALIFRLTTPIWGELSLSLDVIVIYGKIYPNLQ